MRRTAAVLVLVASLPALAQAQGTPLDLAQAPSGGVEDELSRAYAVLSRADYAEGGRLLDALAKRELSPSERARVHLLRAHLQVSTGQPDEALRSVEEAERLAPPPREPRMAARIASVRGTMSKHRGAPMQALHHFKESLAWAERTGDAEFVASQYHNLASVYQELGDWSRALDYGERAFEAQPNPTERARLDYLIHRGIAYFELFDGDRAERDFLEALAIARRTGNRREESWALGELGSTYWQMDRDPSRALDHLEPAIALARAIPVPTLEVTWLNNSARVFRETGRLDEALRRFHLALALELKTGRGRNLPMVLKNIGETLALRGEHAEAEAYLLRARDEADRQNQPKFRWASRMELGQLYASRDPAQADRYFAESIDLLEAHHSNVLLEKFRAGALSRQLTTYDPYDLYVEFLLDQGENARAFLVAERARARAFLDTLSLAREEIGAAVPLEYVRSENALLREISTQQGALRADDLDDAALGKAKAALEASETKLNALRVRLATESPAVANARYPRLWSAEALQRDLLGRDETLLLFYVGRRGSAAWVVRRDTLKVLRMPAREAIEPAVRRYLEAIAVPGASADRSAARALTDILVPGLDEHVPEGSRLIVVPHGILLHLPFEALADAGGRYFVEKYVMSYAPSVSSLAYLRRPPKERERGHRVVAVGNPVAAPAEPAEERDFQIDWIRDLRPLPHSGEELRRIASIFGRATRVLEQEGANEATLARSLEGAAVLHFATHAIVDEEQPDRSGLALTPGAPDSDGILQMREIYRLRVPATLVTLSACRTALGKRLTGEGVIGLSRAFHYAGADTVVASLWNVNDAAAAQWMEIFYGALRDGKPIDEAVRDAKLRFLRSETKLNHPFYWAAFVANGHAAATVPVGTPPYALVVTVVLAAAAIVFFVIYLKSRAARRQPAPA